MGKRGKLVEINELVLYVIEWRENQGACWAISAVSHSKKQAEYEMDKRLKEYPSGLYRIHKYFPESFTL